MKSKAVQIDYELFLNIVKLVLAEEWTDVELLQSVQNGLEEKINKIIRHNIYTRYRASESVSERIKAKEDYLKNIGVQKKYLDK